jgi:hypothetical protein
MIPLNMHTINNGNLFSAEVEGVMLAEVEVPLSHLVVMAITTANISEFLIRKPE